MPAVPTEIHVGRIVYWWSTPGYATAGEVLAIHGDCAWVLRRWQAHGKGSRFNDITQYSDMRIPVTVTLDRLRPEPLAKHGHPGPLPHER